ncbi:unnamed protein product [Phytomonas sp. EM1]|nr:unnamed protein product [Phytomonas sp. EM1]|eukprot:CCW64992.1 unnamed protein product [Phytomonas sp. isolate EM1]
MHEDSHTLPAPTGSSESLSGGLDPTTLPSEPPVCRITPKEWFAVAKWSWDATSEVCGICKNALVDACVDCQTRGLLTSPPPPSSTSSTLATTNCRVAWGGCRHVFHEHCLSRWLVQRAVCPVCGQDWKLQGLTSND